MNTRNCEARRARLTRRSFIRNASVAAIAAPQIMRAANTRGFEIGLAADAQYADIEAKNTRFYRASMEKLGAAVDHFNGRELAFCVHLGDLIDRNWKSFDDIVKPLAGSRHKWHQLLGNHDFEVVDEMKTRVPQRLGMAWRYGAFESHGLQFVVLDTNDVTVYAHPAGSPEKAAAEKELARLQAAKVKQAKSWNGAVGDAQLAWFDRTCAEAGKKRQKVIVLAHHPVFPDGQHTLWNASEMLATIDRHPQVVAWINGHNHAGAYGERNGVPYLTMKGMVETKDTNAFATAQILPDRIVLTGHGREPSREMKFRSA